MSSGINHFILVAKVVGIFSYSLSEYGFWAGLQLIKQTVFIDCEHGWKD